MLANARAEGKIAGKQAHHERADDIDDQGPEREAISQEARGADIHSVTKGPADPGPNKDDQVKHKPPTAAVLRS
jgi:hypothetical protein